MNDKSRLLSGRKILFLITKLTNGGAERALSVLVSELARQGYQVALSIDYPDPNKYPLAPEVTVLRMPPIPPHTKNPFSEIARLLKKHRDRIRLIRSYAPDILIPFLPGIIEPTFLANAHIHAKFILPIRNNPWICNCSCIRRLLVDIIAHFSDAVFVQCPAQAKYFPQKMQHKIFYVFNPVSTEMLSGRPHCTKVPRRIITAGRLEKQKNHSLLIEAFAAVIEKHPDAKLLIYGVGSQKDALEHLIQSLGLSGKAILAGRTSNIPLAYQQADIFVLSSNFEGMPNALMEAMASGLPCISTDCPTGPSDLLKDGESGLIVPVNDKTALSSALLYLMDNPDYAARIAAAGRIEIEQNYLPPQIAATFVQRLAAAIFERSC